MKIKINYPSDDESKRELNKNINDFKAILIVETIKKLNLSDKDKRKLIDKIISAEKGQLFS